jgi:cytochrome c
MAASWRYGVSAVIGLFAVAVLAACASMKSDIEMPPVAERGHSPWVFRSVLDRHPRMITFALSKSMWVAYDTQHAKLYKVWRDGVEFDGAVYTTRHGPQPAAEGAGYIVNTLEAPWRVIVDGREVAPTIQYLGHRFHNDRAAIRYALTVDGGPRIEIEEWPEVFTADDGRPGFFRRFDILSNASNATVVLATNVQSLNSAEDVRTNGRWTIQERNDQNGSLSVIGKLELRSKQTVFATTFAAQPAVVPPAPVATADPATEIMQSSDCNVCHNADQHTVGPSYKQIAKRYKTTERNVDLLAQKIIAGGAGAWGDVPMSPHTEMPPRDARLLAAYVLALDKEDKEGVELGAVQAAKETPKSLPRGAEAGVTLRYYEIEDAVPGVPVIEAGQQPSKLSVLPALSLTMNPSAPGEYGFEEFQRKRKFVIHASGMLHIQRPGEYALRVEDGTGGSRLFLRSRKIIETQANAAPQTKVQLEAGWHPFTIEYSNSAFNDWHTLQLLWSPPGENESVVPPSALATEKPNRAEVTPGYKTYTLMPPIGVPGDQLALQDVHPSLQLVKIRPEDFRPKVAGMDFLSDGRLVISTWSPEGGVYVLDGIQGNDPARITIKQVAAGLAEPLGLKVVNDEIYVLQKQELTHLLDHDGDELIDEYRLVSNDWTVTDNFHEFAFGLLYEDGAFYAALASAILPGGAPAQPQASDRGKLVRIDPTTGKAQTIARGLRTPNGIGYGVDGEKFIADNQGNWLPASKIVHVQKGAFYGFREVDPERDRHLQETPPVAWLPQDEIGNSPSNPVPLDIGIYKGQMIHGDVTHGGLKRLYVEKVNGHYQGCVFRFSQGLEAGVNRTIWGPNGALYVGGIGNPGNWSHAGKLFYGLQKLVPTDAIAFEMLAVRPRTNGIEVEFTKPLRPGDGLNPEDYSVRQWRYVPSEEYGGDKIDPEALTIRSVALSPDRRRAQLLVDGIKPAHVVYVRIANPFISADNEEMWSTESWCTVNALAQERIDHQVNEVSHNVLTDEEKQAGWRLLFDGQSTKGWRTYGKASINNQWRAMNGELTLTKGGGGDIITVEQFENFDLQFEWKISPNGNSGALYMAQESDGPIWHSAPEMQILDDDGHPDGRIPSHRAGANYDLQVPKYTVTKPVGEFNTARILSQNGHIEHWLNGRKIAEYEHGSAEWRALVKASKFANLPDYARVRRGHIGFQDHGDRVWLRNIKIKPL